MNFAEDIKTVFEKDPAARGLTEVLLCYPGLHAVWVHRAAHLLWVRGLFLPARLLSHLARFFTGIEIHPGATIGRRFFIDHGMGVVIGETTEIGDDVLLYQGVVLGGTTLEHKKRHPTLGNGVVVGAGAIVLGAINIGARSRIGAGSVVLHEIAPDTTVFGVPAHSARGGAAGGEQLDHNKLPDHCGEQMRLFQAKLDALRAELAGK
ncbi:MAG: serine O-acetyltransferase [Elusimicrobia bacterium RIFOXYA2_FULL_58_8]|nr:MAG: serine O-acetyltransferase [Elusimicrobia bacterium RIFOXYA12_FULL_57_11]OGS13870.1 MAG: serine O-acetyltransferase [Elusimicrobia bacterium RIFOXYA2_FULL_58_8]